MTRSPPITAHLARLTLSASCGRKGLSSVTSSWCSRVLGSFSFTQILAEENKIKIEEILS